MNVVFFTDRDVGKQFPDILRASGCRVERHADHFAPTASDESWLAHVGRKGWCAVTHDARIRYKPNELAAVERHRVRLLVVVGKAPLPQLAIHPTANQFRADASRTSSIVSWLANDVCP